MELLLRSSWYHYILQNWYTYILHVDITQVAVLYNLGNDPTIDMKISAYIFTAVYHTYIVGWIQTRGIVITHYCDVIMGAIASQITSRTIVYSTVYSDADQRRHQSSASLAFAPETGEFPAQKASTSENVSIWWRHNASSRKQYSYLNLSSVLLVVAVMIASVAKESEVLKSA